MHIIDTIEIIDGEVRGNAHPPGPDDSPPSYFIWNRAFLESCQADNLRQLDLDEYFSLKSAISKRLYRFLGKRFYRQDDWTFDLHEIAFERVGLSRSYADAGKIKEKLQPALDELERIGFLKPLSRNDRYTKIDRGQWSIRLIRQSPMLAVPQQAASAAVEPEPPLVAELVSRGVTRATAADLVRQYPADAIEAKLEVFDWLMEKQDKRVARSPAGYLVKSITDDYATPKGFESKATRQARAEAKRQADREASERRRCEREQAARDQAIREEVDAYIKRLTPAERKALEAEALARADAETRQTYEEAAPARFRASVLLGLVREHVAQELLRRAIPAEG